MENPSSKTNVTSLRKSSALPEAWIDRLFARFEGMYGAKFAAAWQNCDLRNVKAVWAEDLGGYSGQEIAAGIAKCRELDWPPTLPEFLKACRPPIDYHAALLEAIEQMARRDSNRDQWSHPAIFWAATRIGAFDLSRMTAKELEPRWRKEFGEQMALWQWPEIPVRREALPAPGQTHSRDVGKETVAAMLARLKRSADAHAKEQGQ